MEPLVRIKVLIVLFVLLLFGYAEADRLVTSGFETNSATAGVENQLEAVTGTAFTVQGTVYRSGAYAAKFLPSSSNGFVTYNFTPLATGQTLYERFYIYVGTNPATDTYIMKSKIAAGTVYYGIKLTTTGTLQLTNGTTQIGSDSGALTAQTWYMVEVAYTYATGAVSAKLNGATAFASGTATTSKAINQMDLGSIDSPATGEWYMDDIGVNNSVGSYQNTWLGEGKVVHLMPVSNGPVLDWSCSGGIHTGSLDEVPPDNATSFCSTASSGQYETGYFADFTEGYDSINVIHLGLRANRSSAGSGSVAVSGQLYDGVNGYTQQNVTGNLGTSWITNAVTSPKSFIQTEYVEYDGSTPFDDTYINGLHYALYLSTAGGRTAQVTTVWLVVEYTSPSFGADPLYFHHKSSTYNSFKLAINQGSTTGSPTLEDRFYISEHPIYSEPETSPQVTLTSLGHTEVEFTGLQPDKFYYVYAARYLNGTFYHDSLDTNYCDAYYCNGFTLNDTIRVKNGETITIDWSSGNVFDYWIPGYPFWVNGASGCPTAPFCYPFTIEADPTHILGGDYYFHYPHSGSPIFMSRWNFDPSSTITYEFDFRLPDAMLFPDGPEFCMYAGEPEYACIIVHTDATGENLDSDNGGLWSEGLTIPQLTQNTVYHMKIEATGGNVVSFYIDTTLIAQFTKSWALQYPQRFWGASGHWDMGPVSMTGTQVWGNVDFSYAPFWDFDDRTKFSIIVGSEQNSSAGSVRANMGGILNAASGMINPYWDTPDTQAVDAVTWTFRTPVIKPKFGYKYSSLLLQGLDNSGTLKVQVKDSNGDLVSDSYITDNSTGFFLTGDKLSNPPSITTIDLSNVPFSGIKFEVTGTTSNLSYACTATDVPWTGCCTGLHTGTCNKETQSPRFQYGGIKFTTGNLVDILIDPVTTPTSSSTQTITGSMGSGNTVSVSTNHGYVGTVTYPTSTTWSVDLSGMCGDDFEITATATLSGNNSSELAFIDDTITCTPASADALFMGGD